MEKVKMCSLGFNCRANVAKHFRDFSHVPAQFRGNPYKQKKGGSLQSDRKGRFYWNGKNITMTWLEFFAMLPMEKEKDCVALFTKKWGRKLNKLYPPI